LDRRTLLSLLAAGQLLPASQMPALADTPNITTVRASYVDVVAIRQTVLRLRPVPGSLSVLWLSAMLQRRGQCA
jgi:hypothetical protein